MPSPAQIPPLTIRPSAPLPVSQLVSGKPVDEVADLLPRIFNLCASAQGCAARLALGLDLRPEDRIGLSREILRDHLMRLLVLLPARLNLPISRVPHDIPDMMPAVFATDSAPQTPETFDRFMQSESGIAPLLARIATLFPDKAASGDALAPPDAAAWPGVAATENSVAARHCHHAVLRHIEMRHGRGPLWRVTARALDVEACLSGGLPAPRLIAPGQACVAAARGTYFLRAEVRLGRVAALERITPTDHMLAPNGILAQSLNSLPGSMRHLAPLVVEIFDPCSPISLKEGAQDA